MFIVLFVIMALLALLRAYRAPKRIYYGFLFAPIIPCISFFTLLASHGEDVVLILIFAFVACFVCYLIILLFAAPLYFWLARTRQATALNCSAYSFGIGSGMYLLLANLKWLGFDHFLDSLPMLATAGIFGLLGASIGFLFWLIALSPVCGACKMAHGR
jgi:hypothetical protein